MRTHENMLRVIAADLGEERAAMLVSDALVGGDPAILRLQRIAGVRAFKSFQDREFLHISKRLSEEAFWSGDTLYLKGGMPESLTTAMAGMELGRIVAGTRRDDCVIEEARSRASCIVRDSGPDPSTTEIKVATSEVGPDRLAVSRRALRMRPFRMAVARMHLLWHGHREERFDIPIHDSIPETVLVILALLAFLCLLPLFMAVLFAIETMDGSRAARRRCRRSHAATA